MQPTQKPYKPGSAILIGLVLGAFVGLLLSKLALGAIFGLVAGMVVDSNKRKANAAPQEKSPDDAGQV